MFGYAYNVALIGFSLKAIEETCERLVRVTERIGLSINDDIGKIMVLKMKTAINPPKKYVEGKYVFQCVYSFKYLGSIVNEWMYEDR